MIKWDRLRTFYYVAQAGSFTGAGERLNISQSSISRTIMNLEGRLGYKLFIRSPRGLELTEAGKIWLNLAQKIFDDIERVQNTITESEEQPAGDLSILTTPGMAATIVRIIPEFRRCFPKVRLSVVAKDMQPDFVFQGTDVAIMPYTVTQSALIALPLTRFQLGLYASPNYLKEFGLPEKPEDLVDHSLISYGLHSHPFQEVDDWHLKLGLDPGEKHEPIVTVNSEEHMLYLAEQGLGIATITQGNENLLGTDLVKVLPKIQGPSIEFQYIYPKRLKDSKKVQAFHRFLSDSILNENQSPKLSAVKKG